MRPLVCSSNALLPIPMAAIKVLYFSLPLLLCFLHCYAQNGIVNLKSSIVAGSNDFWVSPSGEFAFGFHEITPDRYLVGIVFDKIPERTLVWSANRDNPANAKSTIIFGSTGEFALIHANDTKVSIYDGTDTTSAFMSDDGNFQLLNSSSDPIWQSFDHPTDTLLPGQVFKLLLHSEFYILFCSKFICMLGSHNQDEKKKKKQ